MLPTTTTQKPWFAYASISRGRSVKAASSLRPGGIRNSGQIRGALRCSRTRAKPGEAIDSMTARCPRGRFATSQSRASARVSVLPSTRLTWTIDETGWTSATATIAIPIAVRQRPRASCDRRTTAYPARSARKGYAGSSQRP
jgi:hypothetical protein